MQLLKALGIRAGYGALSLFFIIVLSFLASAFAPGDPATIIAGEKAPESVRKNIRAELGLDQPLPAQFLRYLRGIARGDLGKSYHGQREPVTDIVKRTLPYTLRNAVLAIVIAGTLGITFGTIAALREAKLTDRTVIFVTTLCVTIPNFVLAPLLVRAFGSSGLDLFPSQWETQLRDHIAYYLALPVLVLSLRPAALLTRLTRAAVIESLRMDYMKLGTAKGVPPFRLISRYALRNAILPIVTAIGTTFGYLLTGSFVVETYFVMPGLGQTAIQAITQNNTPVIMGCVLVSGALFIIINTIVDLVLPILDPRIRESQI